MEALRLLSDLLRAPMDIAADLAPIVPPQAAPAPISGQEWDAAIVSAQLDDLLGTAARSQADVADVSGGLTQLDRYLARAWYRAGIAPQQHDDCTQAVYTSMLQALGRDGFDHLLGDVGHSGIRDVLSRETAEGVDFFRAVDTVKKRAQRERSFQPLDGVEAAASTGTRTDSRSDLKDTLHEAIVNSLSPREAALIRATLQGETPAEIAQQWGIAPKTVSNEKTRAFQKLRDVLGSDYQD